MYDICEIRGFQSLNLLNIGHVYILFGTQCVGRAWLWCDCCRSFLSYESYIPACSSTYTQIVANTAIVAINIHTIPWNNEFVPWRIPPVNIRWYYWSHGLLHSKEQFWRNNENTKLGQNEESILHNKIGDKTHIWHNRYFNYKWDGEVGFSSHNTIHLCKKSNFSTKLYTNYNKYQYSYY